MVKTRWKNSPLGHRVGVVGYRFAKPSRGSLNGASAATPENTTPLIDWSLPEDSGYYHADADAVVSEWSQWLTRGLHSGDLLSVQRGLIERFRSLMMIAAGRVEIPDHALNDSLVKAAEAKTRLRWSRIDDRIQSWVRSHVNELVAAEVISGAGLTTAQRARLERLRVEGATQAELNAVIDQIVKTQAEMIAQTESIKASNAAKQIAWEQSVEEGRIDVSRTRKRWVVIRDERLCDNCRWIAAQGPVELDALFETPLGYALDYPPLHPRCRCSIALVYGQRESKAASVVPFAVPYVPTLKQFYSPTQPRDEQGQWVSVGGGAGGGPIDYWKVPKSERDSPDGGVGALLGPVSNRVLVSDLKSLSNRQTMTAIWMDKTGEMYKSNSNLPHGNFVYAALVARYGPKVSLLMAKDSTANIKRAYDYMGERGAIRVALSNFGKGLSIGVELFGEPTAKQFDTIMEAATIAHGDRGNFYYDINRSTGLESGIGFAAFQRAVHRKAASDPLRWFHLSGQHDQKTHGRGGTQNDLYPLSQEERDSPDGGMADFMRGVGSKIGPIVLPYMSFGSLWLAKDGGLWRSDHINDSHAAFVERALFRQRGVKFDTRAAWTDLMHGVMEHMTNRGAIRFAYDALSYNEKEINAEIHTRPTPAQINTIRESIKYVERKGTKVKFVFDMYEDASYTKPLMSGTGIDKLISALQPQSKAASVLRWFHLQGKHNQKTHGRGGIAGSGRSVAEHEETDTETETLGATLASIVETRADAEEAITATIEGYRSTGRVTVDLRGMSDEAAKEVALAFTKTIDEYPGLADAIDYVGYRPIITIEDNPNVIGQTTNITTTNKLGSTNVIEFRGPKWGWGEHETFIMPDFGIQHTKREFDESLSDEERTGFYAKGNGNIRGVVDHELGHVVANVVTARRVQDARRWSKENKLDPRFSLYGITSYQEYFAEAFSASRVGNPHPAARSAKRLADTYLKPTKQAQAASESLLKWFHLSGKHNQKTHGRGGSSADGVVVDPFGTITERQTAAAKTWFESKGYTHEKMMANIDAIYDRTPQSIRDKGKHWFQDGHDLAADLGKEFGFSTEQVCGALAAMSPHNVWTDNPRARSKAHGWPHGNQSTTRAVLEIVSKEHETYLTTKSEQVRAQLQRDSRSKQSAIRNRPFDGTQYIGMRRVSDLPAMAVAVLHPDSHAMRWGTEKAIRILRGEPVDSVLRGAKVRSFHDNLINPRGRDHVAVDTMVARMLTNNGKLPNSEYGAMVATPARYKYLADAIKLAAKRRGIDPPSRYQATTWLQWRIEHPEAVRDIGS